MYLINFITMIISIIMISIIKVQRSRILRFVYLHKVLRFYCVKKKNIYIYVYISDSKL